MNTAWIAVRSGQARDSKLVLMQASILGLPLGKPSSPTARALAIVATLLYLIGVSAFILRQGGWPTPDFLIPPLILAAIFAGKGWTFVFDWLPFLLLLLVYESFRGIADDLNSRVHIEELVQAERWLTGGIPTIELQTRFFDPASLAWYDWGATLLHVAHFGVPVGIGFGIWLSNRALYWRFAGAVIGLCFGGFLFQYIYPAAPPWMAADMGFMPHIDRVIGHTTGSIATGSGVSLAYQEMSPNEVAAMPSLHAAMPALLFMIVVSLKGWRWLPFAFYPLVGGIAWIYIGEHYLVDVLAGLAWAVVAYVLFWVLLPRVVAAMDTWRPALVLNERFQRMRPLPSWPLAIGIVIATIYSWTNPILPFAA